MATADMTRSVPPASSWDLDGIEPEVFEDGGGDGDGFTAADVFVATAITLASAALTLALIVQTGTPILAAVLTGGCVWMAMLIGHSALRRVDSRAAAGHLGPYDVVDADADRAPRPVPAPVWVGQATRRPEGRGRDRRPMPVDDAGRAGPTLSAPEIDPTATHRVPAGAPLAASSGATSRATRTSGARSEAAPAELPTKGQRIGQPAMADRIATEDDGAWLADLDLGDFRPKAAPELPAMVAKPAPGPGMKDGHEDKGAGDEDIDAMLRRLANDISRGRKMAAAEAAAPEAAAPEAATPRAERAVAPIISPDGPAGGRIPAPRANATGAAAPLAAQSGAAGKPTPPPLPPAFPPDPARATTSAGERASEPVRVQTAAGRLAAIADALSDEQIDVFLETINGLDDYRARHYEVSVRLRLRDGETLDNEKLIAETRGSGLLPLIEAVKVSSTRRVAVQMIRRGRSGDFFSLVDGEALDTRQFGRDMETIIGGDQALAERLVLAFSQADVRAFTTAQWDSLRDIAGLGFRFSVEEITDLDMDFEKLASNGFAFAKLDAECFLKGLPIENSRVPAADICRHLSGAGLALIVGNIGDETTRAKILGFGALFGQGALFGAPRPVRSDVLRQRQAASAAH